MAGRLADRVFGPSLGQRLPERVQRAIAAQQLSSEQLIGWTQLAVVLIFGALYFISPKTFRPDVMLEPVPLVLGAYLAFSVVRLPLLYRGFQARWFLGLSVIADMSLLMVLIWSFHLQYEQPAAFYLKVPTLIYVFIFIALRALRFDVAFLILAGVTAAAGWLVLVLYAAKFADPPGEITRNYVLYLTSNRVLLGAEFDKVIAILLTTAILAVAIVRARRLLVRAVAESAAAQELSRFFAPEIAATIAASDAAIKPGHGEHRDAAILHCDIRGFTALSLRMPPDDLMRLLAEYQARMAPPIRAHGGSIDKFLGDGVLASFGAASANANYAADGLKAAHALIAAADAWAAERQANGLDPIRTGVTVAAGPVVFGAVGDASRLEYTVIGDAVNLAVKLDKQCKVENCRALTSAETFGLATAQGYAPPGRVERRPRRAVEGVAGPIDLVVLEF